MNRHLLPAFRHEGEEEGFTLIELVIVVAIIGILTAVAIPAYGAIQDLARLNAVKSSISSLITSLSALEAAGKSAEEIQSAFEDMNADSDHILLSAGYTDNMFDGLHPTVGEREGRWCVIGTWINDPALKPAGTINYVNQYGNGSYSAFHSGPGSIFEAWAAWDSYGGIKASSAECTITLAE